MVVGAPVRSASQSVVTSQREVGLSFVMTVLTCLSDMLLAFGRLRAGAWGTQRFAPSQNWRRNRANVPCSCKRNPHAPILLALLFDLRHAYLADFIRRAHVGAAARLQVISDDFDQPHAASTGRGLDRHGLDQARSCREFRIRDPARAYLGSVANH